MTTREAMRKGFAEGRNNPGPVATTFWLVVLGTLFVTVGWNYGITEMIESLGGPEGNINLLEGGAAFLLCAAIGTRVGGTSPK
jgi:hypothetical protein